MEVVFSKTQDAYRTNRAPIQLEVYFELFCLVSKWSTYPPFNEPRLEKAGLMIRLGLIIGFPY